MSIIIHFTPASTLLSSSTVPPTPACVVDAETSLDMGPALGNDSGLSILSLDDSSMVDISTTELYSEKENVHMPSAHHSLGSCFGLPYQDHNYGAPPPPTPPSHSPPMSPIHTTSTVIKPEPIPSLATVVVRNEEVPETSITRCVCGFDHDDEYMICCDRCSVWQHVDCMGLDRNKIPETYLCEKCEPRKVDRQKAKVLQAKKRVTMTGKKLIYQDTSDESEEDQRHEKSSELSSKTRSKSSKRKTDDDKEIKNEHVARKGRSNSKHGKERMEIKRSKFRRRTKSKSESACVGDEEAQDAWKCSSDWSRKREDSVEGSSDTQSLGATSKSQMDEMKVPKLQLQDQLCQLVEFAGNQKKLVAATDLPKDQIIIEFKGQFLSATQFHQKNPVFRQKQFPFVLFYKLRSHEELCVDASENGNDARFVRRSCMPNAEIRHLVTNGALHLYISSIKEICKDEEITIPFDVNFKDCLHEVDCACDSDTCFITKRKTDSSESSDRRKRGRRHTHSTDDDSNHSFMGALAISPVKPTKSLPVKAMSPTKQVTAVPPVPNVIVEQSEGHMSSEDHLHEEHLKEQRKKMTREERKLDAIMRAFDQMEKAAKRKQQALDRQAQQKALHQKTDEPSEKQEIVPSPVKEEEKHIGTENSSSVDDEKPTTSTQPVKNKKGKRRRGSGTPIRRRTRTNSGGSDIFNADDNASPCETSSSTTTTTVQSLPLPTPPSVETSDPVSPETVVACCLASLSSPQQSVTVLPKTKRFLHNEWLHEKESTVPVSSPLSIHTEMSYNMVLTPSTRYVRCTKDNPTSTGGISAAHLRRSSYPGHGKASNQGSAKKRWLRQAMYDYEPIDGDSGGGISMEVINGEVCSPPHAICFSPSNQSEVGSPGVVTIDDVLTPLKKRRILRSSVESVSSSEWMGASSEMSPDNSSCDSTVESCVELPAVITNVVGQLKNEYPFHKNDEKCIATTGNGLSRHLLKTLRENWIKNDNNSKTTISTDIDDNPINMLNGCVDSSMQISNLEKECSENEQHLAEENSVAKARISDEESLPILPVKVEVVEVQKLVANENNVKLEPVHEQNSEKGHELIDESETVVKEDKVLSIKSLSPGDLGSSSSQTDILLEKEPSTPLTVPELVPLSNAQDKLVEDISDNCIPVSDHNVTEASKQAKLLHDTISRHITELDMESTDAQSVSLENSSSNVNSVSISSSDVSVSVVDVPSSLCSNEITSESAIVDEINPGESKLSNSTITEQLPIDTSPAESPSKSLSSSSSPTTPKRKVSLSEYRQRKREHPSPTTPTSDKKKSNNCVLDTAISLEEFSDSDIKLAALPLFESAVNKSEQCSSEETKNSKKEASITDAEKHATKPRENLNERLKREFGLVDETGSDKNETETQHQTPECTLMNMTPDVSAPMLSFCPQIPPPPPPPLPGLSLEDKNSTSMQFSYPIPQPYVQQPYAVSQITTNQYMTAQTPVVPQIIPVIHPMTPSSACNYSATMQTTVTRPSQPTSYSPVNNQSFSVMAQQLNSPYHPLFKSQVQFK